MKELILRLIKKNKKIFHKFFKYVIILLVNQKRKGGFLDEKHKAYSLSGINESI
jgi:hypothetical protein